MRYRFDTTRKDDIAKELNEMAAQGWRLHTISFPSSGDSPNGADFVEVIYEQEGEWPTIVQKQGPGE